MNAPTMDDGSSEPLIRRNRALLRRAGRCPRDQEAANATSSSVILTNSRSRLACGQSRFRRCTNRSGRSRPRDRHPTGAARAWHSCELVLRCAKRRSFGNWTTLDRGRLACQPSP